MSVGVVLLRVMGLTSTVAANEADTKVYSRMIAAAPRLQYTIAADWGSRSRSSINANLQI